MGNSSGNNEANANHLDSVRISNVSMPIMNSDYLRNYKNKPSIQDAPSTNYAIMVDSMPDLPHAAKTALSNYNSRSPLDSTYPVYYIREKNAYYQGKWEKGLPHGVGSVQFSDGSLYEGQFENGEAKCEKGLIVFPNGAIYEGHISNSTIEGFGRLTYPEQIMVYTGQWQNGVPHGLGQQCYSDQSSFQGHFVNGVKEGPGRLTMPDKTVYNGNFVDGQAHDQGAILKNEEKKFQYQGGICEGRKHGHGRLINCFGEMDGYFVDNYIAGKGVFRWKDGRIYVGEFENNQLHGNGRVIFPGGQVIEGVWEKGVNRAITEVHNRTVAVKWMYTDANLRTEYSGHPKRLQTQNEKENFMIE